MKPALPQPNRERPRHIAGRWLTDYPRGIPLAIFLLIAAITAMSVFAIERSETKREQSVMREVAQSVSNSLERRSIASASYLRAGAALFTTVDDIDLAAFRRFVRELRLDTDFRGAEGIGWAEVLTPQDVPSFKQRVGTDLSSTVSIMKTQGRGSDRIVPVTFLLPNTERNRRAMGYDMYADPVRRAAMEEAERMVRPTASRAIVLAQEGNSDAPGFLIYMPVFAGEGTNRALKGFVYSPFNAQTFLDASYDGSMIGNLGIHLYDGAPSPDNLIASHMPAAATGIFVEREVSLANQTFTLVVESAHDGNLSSFSMATLLFGLAVAVLLMLMARILTAQALEDQATLASFEQQNSIRDSLTRELNHRVKNTLANILSIISLTRRRADDLEEFANGLEARIRAISATHDLLTQSQWATTPIRSIVEAEVGPYLRSTDSILELNGPDLEVAPNDALSLGLAIHELATNAAKFGALSVPGGRVLVDWALERDGLALLEWREFDGPAVPALRERGFGTELIEKIVAHELKHPVELAFDEKGVECTLRVPVRLRGEFKIREGNV